jgi:asparagine synthase (glutamine-hydrolysing)
MPYPVHRCFTQAIDGIAFEIAAQCGADVVVDGGGGDNVFFATRSVSILADCLLTTGFDRRFWRAAHALGDLARTGIVALTRKAVRRAWRRDRAPRLPARTEFLSSAAKERIQRGAPHPFFRPPRDVLPGRAAHGALLAPAQNLVEALNAQALFPSLSPLVSQPVIETCLRVPSWFWIAPGRNRDAVRRAFATDLPSTVVERRSKGSPTQFVATIFERNRPVIREMLLGGFLAEKGLIDTAAVAAALRAGGPARDLRFARIMELVDAEAWARAQWGGICRSRIASHRAY